MTRNQLGFPVPPLALCIGAALIQRHLGRDAGPPGSVGRALAVATGLASAATVGSSVASFRMRQTTVDPREGAQPSVLVTKGVNNLTRNPMYLGMAGLLLAHAAWSGRRMSLIPAAAFVGWMDRVQIPAEEADLRTLFGESFEDYAARVPRWVGPTSRAMP